MFKKLIENIKSYFSGNFYIFGKSATGTFRVVKPRIIEKELFTKEEMELTPKLFDSNCIEFQCVIFDNKIWNADKDVLEKLGLNDGQAVDAKTLIEIIQESKTKLEELAT